MATSNLTARKVETPKPTPGKRIELFDATVSGLTFRVTETGHKIWTVHYPATPSAGCGVSLLAPTPPLASRPR